MYAQLGNFVFENLKGFTEYSKTGAAVYAEHALLDSKPRLQRTGSALAELSISARFHASFCNPVEQLKALKTFRDDGEILPLLWGNGTVEGSFVITEISETIEHADAQGNVFSYLVELTFREYVTRNKIQQQQEANKKNATATGNKKPVAKKKANPPTCPQIISNIITRIENHGAIINRMYVERGGYANNKRTIVSNATAISSLATDLKNRTENPQSCVYNEVQIRVWAQTVNSDASTIAFLNSPTPQDNTQLQVDIKKLKAAAQPFLSKVITRKP